LDVGRSTRSGGDTPKGVALVNLGSPDAPTPGAVRRYLAEFLSDPLVVDANRILWWLVRNAIVLPLRSRSSARLYREVWTSEGSPLIAISRRQRELLERELGSGWRVALGMRYGRPSLQGALEELHRAGCREIVLLGAFPQSSRSTTGSLELAACRAALSLRPEPRVVAAAPYFEHAGYVEALAERVREAAAGERFDQHVFSFHGLPLRYVERGDPYRDQCEATARALAARLGLAEAEWTLVYQSRFGREPWLQPYAAEAVPAMAARHPRVLVACPGFVADCLETLDEIGRLLRGSFLAAGGEDLRLVPCLNDHPRWIEAMADLARSTLAQAG
jgi:ferrochelatase